LPCAVFRFRFAPQLREPCTQQLPELGSAHLGGDRRGITSEGGHDEPAGHEGVVEQPPRAHSSTGVRVRECARSATGSEPIAGRGGSVRTPALPHFGLPRRAAGGYIATIAGRSDASAVATHGGSSCAASAMGSYAAPQMRRRPIGTTYTASVTQQERAARTRAPKGITCGARVGRSLDRRPFASQVHASQSQPAQRLRHAVAHAQHRDRWPRRWGATRAGASCGRAEAIRSACRRVGGGGEREGSTRGGLHG